MTLQQRIDADIALAYRLHQEGREEESMAISKVVTQLRKKQGRALPIPPVLPGVDIDKCHHRCAP
jgi:hypothetical protein